MADGFALADYAAAKGLPLDFLRECGVTEGYYNGRIAVQIPYFNEAGVEVAVRWRLAPTGDGRFRWRRGDTPVPYGLSRLATIRAAGHVILCEGESDAQTLWHHGEPALGLPGAASWRPEWDALLIGVDVIYVMIEPDAGGQAVLKWLATSSLRSRVRLVHLAGAKDISELYLADPVGFGMKLLVALDGAEPYREHEDTTRARCVTESWTACAALATAPRILAHVTAAVRSLGVVRERRAIQLVFLAVVSRLLERPVSVALKGPSAAGKSFLVQQVLRLAPPSAAYALTAMSERALAYSEEPLSHRMLVLYEAAGLQSDFASYLIRSLLSEGRLRYETVDKTPKGMRSRLIEREGPTGLIVTTTLLRLHPENETRLFSVPVTDTNEQTAAVLCSFADDGTTPVDLAPWHALQEWLALGETRVHIPYARQLMGAIRPVALRLRRDIRQVLTLIEAHALLHRATRAVDSQGRIVATLGDYAAVRRLVEPLVSAGVGLTVPPTVREVVAAVESFKKDEVTVREVADALGLDKSAASRRVQRAIDDGYLKNEEQRGGYKARLRVDAAMPDDSPVLPPARRLLPRGREGSPSLAVRVQPCDHPQDGADGSGCTVAGVLAGIDYPSPPAEPAAYEVWDVP